MSNNADELASLRARFIELKATLDRRIKENDESLRRIANLNHHIDQLLERSKRHFIADRRP
jgi:predicted nuclease with TOPRIM domain